MEHPDVTLVACLVLVDNDVPIFHVLEFRVLDPFELV